LRTVDFGNSIAVIQMEAFWDCISLQLTSFPDSLIEIDQGAFANSVLITSIRFGKSLSDVDARAFSADLETIVVSEMNPNLVVENGMMLTKDRTRLVFFPHGLRSESLSLPGTVTSVADFVLYSYDAVVQLSIPSVVDIGEQSFAACHSLVTVIFGEPLAQIGSNAFAYDYQLVLTSFPGSVTFIADFAFYECWNLVSVTIPGVLDSISSSCFAYCDSLASVLIEEGVTEIGDWAFAECPALATIVLPNTLSTLNSYAFTGSLYLTFLWIPDSVSQMGTLVMPGSLLNISMPGNISVDGRVFGNCIAMAEVHLRDRPNQYLCAALAVVDRATLFVSDDSGLSPDDKVCDGRDIIIEPHSLSPSFARSRSKLPRQTGSPSRSPFPSRSAFAFLTPTDSPDHSDLIALEIVLPLGLVALFVGMGVIVCWKRKGYEKLDSVPNESAVSRADSAAGDGL
jgi:hypothetical protein